MEQLKKDKWQTWADIVRSEQMEASEQVKLFEDNPEFAHLYFTHFRSPRYTRAYAGRFRSKI